VSLLHGDIQIKVQSASKSGKVMYKIKKGDVICQECQWIKWSTLRARRHAMPRRKKKKKKKKKKKRPSQMQIETRVKNAGMRYRERFAGRCRAYTCVEGGQCFR
jgi:expansin (peptidoglycan-binding protein)